MFCANKKQVAVETKESLKDLKKLDLRNAFITSIEPGMFEGLSTEPGMFEGLSTEPGMFEGLSTEPGMFEGLNSLTYIDLSDNKITSIELEAFVGLSNLGTLVLSLNYFTSLEPEAFAGLGGAQTIYFQDNPLDDKSKDCLERLRRIFPYINTYC
ncbi:leucine-rich repeat domain-containing protein [Candidatus Cytomitobacter indipagum]|uniref:Leucine-rich repeat domain-containing protein n=1 Tax=Candidatus Cytomitobacter indipagum TaxID=2601575 RepID=A0A5C0UE71_9PROT|nr:leucine-rich repeat domain-containing protein [Candidatus Cytomitobacter indipagum]QEK37953.1 leucine-rich repeat domain-containing protein [Candidatus Cytomitobacter indipagum]